MIRDKQLEQELLDAVVQHESSRARNNQVQLGISDLGGCREFIRATIAGIERVPRSSVRGLDGAALGTIVGDALETIIGAQADKTGGRVHTQVPATVAFPNLGIDVSGHADIWIESEGRVIDLKSVNGFGEVEKEGPSLKYLIQVSCYAKALVCKSASLAYYDRAGTSRTFRVFTLSEDEIESYYLLAQQRLEEVFDVLDHDSTGESWWSLRDQEPGTCHFFGCPFRVHCWGGSEWVPPQTIETEDGMSRVANYVAAREAAKSATTWKAEAKEALRGIVGVTADGKWSVSWRPGRYDDRLDVIPVGGESATQAR